jgi:hypothetical protein
MQASFLGRTSSHVLHKGKINQINRKKISEKKPKPNIIIKQTSNNILCWELTSSFSEFSAGLKYMAMIILK